MENFTDNELIHAYEQGEQAAAGILYSRYFHKVVSLCRTYLSFSPDAEDVAQDVMVKILVKRKIRLFRGDSQLWSWIYRITINACKAYLRRKSNQPWRGSQSTEMMDQIYPSDAQPDAVDRLLNHRMKKRLMLALWKLPSKYRLVILSVYFQERTYLETSREFSLPPATLGVRVLRGKEKLYSLFKSEKTIADLSLTEVFIRYFEEFYKAA